MEFVIITGLSGAGKSRAAEYLEDSGFYIVDNLPPKFMPRFAEFCLHSDGRYDRVAMVIDVRTGNDFTPLLEALDEVEQMDCGCKILFMAADLPTIIRRYKETRRVHPLGGDGTSLELTAQRERELLAPVRARATWILDTTPFVSTSMLQTALRAIFATQEATTPLNVVIMSFGYKYGLPLEADLVLDARFLPNPHYVAELKALTGRDQGIVDFLNGFPVTEEFLSRAADLLDFLLPQYAEDGRRTLTLAIGCTGGRHRSVAMTCALAKRLRGAGYSVTVSHRDLARG